MARAIASSSKSRLSANAQMAADAARPQPMLKRKTVRVDYTAGEASDDEFVAGPPAVLGDWQRGSQEPLGLEGSREGGEESVVDNDDMEEEVIGETFLCVQWHGNRTPADLQVAAIIRLISMRHACSQTQISSKRLSQAIYQALSRLRARQS